MLYKDDGLVPEIGVFILEFGMFDGFGITAVVSAVPSVDFLVVLHIWGW